MHCAKRFSDWRPLAEPGRSVEIVQLFTLGGASDVIEKSAVTFQVLNELKCSMQSGT